MHWLTLAFEDRELERQYRDARADESRSVQRAWWINAAVLLVAMLATDPFLLPNAETRRVTWMVRYLFCLPIILFAVALTFAPKKWFRALWHTTALVVAMILTLSVVGLGVVYKAYGLDASPQLQYHGLLMACIAIIAFHTSLGCRFVPTSVSTLAAGVIWILLFVYVRPELVPLQAFWITMANAVGMLSNYMLERYRRRDFTQRRLIESELRRQIVHHAQQLGDGLSRISVVARPLAENSLIAERYRVIRQLGSGGMGSVHEVERVADGKRLALKVLNGVTDREGLLRFAREAEIAAGIEHPNVVSVVDIDISQSGMLFLVMELVRGASLAQQRGKFGDSRWAIPVLRQIAAALAALHARGIVHRDLKPANVLYDGDTAKVADFGISSLAPDGLDSTVSVGLTQAGAFLGTPAYMAPELIAGARAATPASDMFALGVVAYQLLSGKLPFEGSPVQLRPLPRPAMLPGETGALVDRCLHFDAAARPTAVEARDILSR